MAGYDHGPDSGRCPDMKAEDAFLGIWTVGWICLVICAFLLFYGMTGRAVELSVVGQSIGQGIHCLSFSGTINASIIQGMNNSSWQIIASSGVI